MIIITIINNIITPIKLDAPKLDTDFLTDEYAFATSFFALFALEFV